MDGRTDPPAPRPSLQHGVECPFCDGRDTELVSPFGGQISVAQYWCRKCRTGFDYFKWDTPTAGYEPG